MLRNQASALLRHEHLVTTVPRAKELRPFVERLITIAKRGVADGENAKTLHARRLVMQDLQDRAVVRKLFTKIAPRFSSRPGGYTRLLRMGFRRGDAADLAQVELVGSEYLAESHPEEEAKSATPTPKAKGVGGRLRAAAGRLRRRSEGDESNAKSEAPAAKGAPARKKPAASKSSGSRKKET
jgi:large subunit ribosomal protein L17